MLCSGNRDKVLDAPDLQDNYYLNLLDWSSLNVLSVGLGSTVYLWNTSTCQVIDFNNNNNNNVHVLCIVASMYLCLSFLSFYAFFFPLPPLSSLIPPFFYFHISLPLSLSPGI